MILNHPSAQGHAFSVPRIFQRFHLAAAGQSSDIGLSRASQRIIRQNLVIALGVIALLLIASGFGVIPLSVAVVLHEGSTIVVVLNALRLLAWNEPAAVA